MARSVSGFGTEEVAGEGFRIKTGRVLVIYVGNKSSSEIGSME